MTDLDTLDDGQYTAVVDSIEDGLATVFFERDSDEVGNAVLKSTILPEEARHANAILTVTVSDGELVEATYDPDRTQSRADHAQDRFDQLSKRPPSRSNEDTEPRGE